MNKMITGFFSLTGFLFWGMFFASFCFAQSQPFQASLTPAIAVHDRSVMIEGLALSVWGENPQRGLSIGIANGSKGESVGFSLGFLLNYADSYKGVHWACVNFTQGNFLGWQSGFINYTDQYLKGVQTGFANYARHFKGLQFGLFNFAETATSGLQIGIVNVIPANEWFNHFPNSIAPAMIFLNWRF